MKIGKPKSKRVPVRLRHKIEKASTAKQRKQRKEAKKNPQWRSRLKKDPGIPNLFPYKAKMLAELEESKRKKEEEVQRRRDIAKAQRNGTAVVATETAAAAADDAEEDDEVLLDHEEDLEEDDEMETQDDGNPMAALLASAQVRAQAYAPNEDDDDDDDDEDDEDVGWTGIAEDSNTSSAPARNALPKQALADPVKAVSALLDRMQKTTDGIQRLIDHYQMPPLMTAGTNLTSAFLMEVARKRGRLGKGGVPNLHSAALTVLSDLNEERLVLPAVDNNMEVKQKRATGNGEVQVVSQMAEPFRIEGLWEDDVPANGVVAAEKMVVES